MEKCKDTASMDAIMLSGMLPQPTQTLNWGDISALNNFRKEFLPLIRLITFGVYGNMYSFM